MNERDFSSLLEEFDERLAVELKSPSYANAPALPDFGNEDSLLLGQREFVRRLQFCIWDAEDYCGYDDEYSRENYVHQLEFARNQIGTYLAGKLTDAALFFVPIYITADRHESVSVLVGRAENGRLHVSAEVYPFAQAIGEILRKQPTSDVPRTVQFEEKDFLLESNPVVVYYREEVAKINEA